MEFRRIIEVHHEEFDEIALKKSWVWLNDPEIKSLTITPDLEKENQRRWFESLKSRKDYFVLPHGIETSLLEWEVSKI